MPLGAAFWSPHYGQLTDRCGVAWMVMAQPSKQPDPLKMRASRMPGT